jgi:hypothetical protein
VKKKARRRNTEYIREKRNKNEEEGKTVSVGEGKKKVLVSFRLCGASVFWQADSCRL